jgi:hypothetical protein
MFSLPEPEDNMVIKFNVSMHEVQDIVNTIVTANELIKEHSSKCSIYLRIATSSFGRGVNSRLTIEGEMNGDTVSMVYNLEHNGKDKFITVDLSKFDRIS